jgi:hypothetical protein
MIEDTRPTWLDTTPEGERPTNVVIYTRYPDVPHLGAKYVRIDLTF